MLPCLGSSGDGLLVGGIMEKVKTGERHLRLVPKLEPTELTKMAQADPEILEFLRFVVANDLREEAIELLEKRPKN